jgi:tetratricopeptide (TPR) repeat protein
MAFGQVDTAVEQYQKAVERNPLDSYVLDSAGFALCAAARLQECLQSRLKLLELHPEFDGINSAVGVARLYLGQFAESLDAMQREPEESYRLAGLAMVYSAMGRRGESDVALRLLAGKFARINAYAIAQVHAYRTEADAAFEWLERAYRQHDSEIPFVKSDPMLHNLHDDRRFEALLFKLKLTHEKSPSADQRRVSS